MANEILDKDLLKQSRPYLHCFKNILQTCLNVQDEKVLILGDLGYPGRTIAPLLCSGYFQAAKELNLNVDVTLQASRDKNQDADNEILYALADLPKKSVIILNMSSGIGGLKYLGKSFRAWTKQNNHRFISSKSWANMPNSSLNNAMNALDINYSDLRDRCNALKAQLDPGKVLQVTTKAGTDLHLNIYGKKGINNHGIYTDPGTGGNVPAGEVYLPPRARKKNFGKIVIDGSASTMYGTVPCKTPITLTVENSEIVNITGGEAAEQLQKSIDWAVETSKFEWGVNRICEFGIGMNTGAKLSGAMIVDEKVYGTAHIAQGSNNWFGGTIFSIIHYDHVFKDPTISVDDEVLKL